MIRRLLYDILLFLLPFALYGLYWRIAGRERADAHLKSHPWTLLFISGLLLVVASFVIWGLTEGESPKGVYVPPHLENGQVVPGHVVPAPP